MNEENEAHLRKRRAHADHPDLLHCLGKTSCRHLQIPHLAQQHQSLQSLYNKKALLLRLHLRLQLQAHGAHLDELP